jgi:cell division protein FtsQ
MTQSSSTYQRWTRGLGLAAALAVVVALGALGWRWQATLDVSAVSVVGTTHAAPDSLRALARVDTGTALYDVEPALVEDRVRRYPWVQDASVMRLPTGTLRISVTERTPAALAMTTDGTPAFYLDRHGFCMPLPDSADYDVPLLHGLADAYSPTQPVAHAAARDLLVALAASDAHDLVAELTVQPDSTLRLYTRPTTAHDAIRVEMGRDAFPRKLRQLQAFWTQAVQPRPGTQFSVIDLRFDSQIVTKETSSSAISTASSARFD